jgi:site-specific recombinase XerD
MQLSALVDEFLLDRKSRRLAPKTISWYRTNLRYFLEWLAAEGQPDALAAFPGQARLRAHLLRHSFSVSALRGGMDLMTLKETLGHEDIRTTTIYLAMSEAQLIEQQRKVNPLAGIALPVTVRKPRRT